MRFREKQPLVVSKDASARRHCNQVLSAVANEWHSRVSYRLRLLPVTKHA